LVLYWFPASVQEFKESPLRTSRELALYSAQCVAMTVADAASPIGQKLEIASKEPVVALTDVSGELIGRVDGEKGRLRIGDVEKIVRDEMKKREDVVNRQWDEAKTKSKAGDNAAAVAALQAVWQ